MSIQSKQVTNLIQLYHVHSFKPVDPDANRSWFELGNEVGLDVVIDEEVEKEEVDQEVA